MHMCPMFLCCTCPYLRLSIAFETSPYKKGPPLFAHGSRLNEDGEIATLTMTREQNMILLLWFCQGNIQGHNDDLSEI